MNCETTKDFNFPLSVIVLDDECCKALKDTKDKTSFLRAINEKIKLIIDKTETENKSVNYRTAIYNRAIETYGKELQLSILQEEAAEVIHAVSKMRRNGISNGLIEELADLEIMIEQVKIVLDCAKEIEKIKDEKIKRLEVRMNKGV